MTGSRTSYLERVAAGLCPDCAQPFGVVPQERHTLPRIDRGDHWEFLAPCGHAVLGIKKGSTLAARHGLDGPLTPGRERRTLRVRTF